MPSLVPQGPSIEHPMTVHGTVYARSHTLDMHLPEGITTESLPGSLRLSGVPEAMA